MIIIFKFLDKFTKDIVAIDEIFCKDVAEMESTLRKLRSQVGLHLRFEIAPKERGV